MNLVPPSSELYDRVIGLRVVRAYTTEPIAADDMDALIEAARWTGSSKNRQGWEFVVVDGDALETLASAGSFTDPVRASAVTIALVQTPDGNSFDIGRAAQNIMLAAAARGIGSCPITLHDSERATEVLALPEGYSCTWAVALGYPEPAGEAQQRQRRRSEGMSGRKPVSELVHHQTYGA
jgi:nitroreductase